jgi:hypothetical protein
VSRGLGSMQRDILSSLDAKDGRATTEALMKDISPACYWSDAFRISFYRALNGLIRRCLIQWHKAHGGPKSQYGMVFRRRRRVLLIDVDSVIPNIALAKISAYHKSHGDSVTFIKGLNPASKLDNWSDPWDEVYISCVFARNKDAAMALAKQFPNSEVNIGGTGIDLVTELPPEIERMMPDNSIYHEIYPKTRYTSFGFTMRGCLRQCPFCVVPKKEGKAHPVADIYDIWNKEAEHTHLVLFDNNIW